jgi:uncharacterized protein (TIGR02996 family)
MTQQDALCRAVCEHPDEDVPRLIFADHLEEHGDARRAAFIRKQVELARVPEHDPVLVECRRRNPDAIRGWSMAHTLPPLPAGISWRRFLFRRGFPWLASVTSLEELLQNGDRLFECAPIQALELSHECGTDANWNRFTEWPHLAKVTRLEFAHTRLSADAIRRLCRSPFSLQLRELIFDGHAIAADGLQVLAESQLFKRLRRLEVRHAALAPALAMGALAAAPSGLQELVLADGKFPGTDLAWLMNHPIAEKLVSLDLSGNPLRAAGVSAVMEHCRELTSLRLRQAGLGTEGIRALCHREGEAAAEPRLPSLREDGPAGASPSRPVGLRLLDLSANRLGPASAKLLVESPRFNELVELNVRENPLGTHAIRLLNSRFAATLRADP